MRGSLDEQNRSLDLDLLVGVIGMWHIEGALSLAVLPFAGSIDPASASLWDASDQRLDRWSRFVSNGDHRPSVFRSAVGEEVVPYHLVKTPRVGHTSENEVNGSVQQAVVEP